MLEDGCSHFAGLFAHLTWPHDLALLLLAYMDGPYGACTLWRQKLPMWEAT